MDSDKIYIKVIDYTLEKYNIKNTKEMEVWTPTMQLRFLQKELRYVDRSITCVKDEEKVLQQLCTSNLGNIE